MKQRILKVLLVVVLLAAVLQLGRIIGHSLYASSNRQVRNDDRYHSIVRLVMNNRTFCSGTVVSENLIITAAHCVLEETPLGLMSRGSIEIRPDTNQDTGDMGAVTYATPQMDQAMLLGDFKDYKPRRMITEPEKLSDLRLKNTKFISCGFPLNGDLYCNETTFDKPEDFFWDVNGVLIPGMSGGPTMLPDGTVIAVNVAVHGDKSVISPIYNITKNLGGK